MAKQRKRGGRVTPKGTGATRRTDRPESPQHPDRMPVAHQRDLPQQVRRPTGHGARPVSHNRGNR